MFGRLAQLPEAIASKSKQRRLGDALPKGSWLKGEMKIKYGGCGRLAQLVERLPYKERVRSSSLLTPTIKSRMAFVVLLFIFL